MSLWPLGKLFLKVEQKLKKKAQNIKKNFIILTILKLNISVQKSEKRSLKCGGELFAACVIGEELVS